MKSNLFLLDLDLTLIDKTYQPTIDVGKLIDIVQSRKRAGDVFGLISDTPCATLKQWMKFFQFNGPIVSERGILITNIDGSRKITLETKIDWPLLKRELIDALLKQFPKPNIIQGKYREVFKAGPIEMIPESHVVIINPNRELSFSLHSRRVDRGTFVIDEKFFSEIVESVRKKLDELRLIDEIDVDANPLYAVVILSDKRVVKSLAIPFLRESYPGYRIIMIGDGDSDAELKGHVDVLCAVGNASVYLKKVADRTANKTITSGVLELLEQWKV